ncbi:MAG: hypothetical protein QXP70_03315 [Methanomassiliicoccales archaeon]
MGEEKNVIEAFVEAVEGTKSTVEFTFEDLNIKVPGMQWSLVISGKISVLAKPMHD